MPQLITTLMATSENSSRPSASPLVTIAVPSFNQAAFLDDALRSIFEQDYPVEVFVMDGGSSDGSREIIEQWAPRLAGFSSAPDDGQAAAVNSGVALGTAPYVMWLNSDDRLLPGALAKLSSALEADKKAPAVYGRVWNDDERTGKRTAVWVQPFSRRALSLRCIVSQPGTLIRRSAWEAVGGLDAGLDMALDYDLWWRLYNRFGPLGFVDAFVAVNRDHAQTKTRSRRRDHYNEAMAVVREHNGHVPFKWWLYQPYAVWWRSLRG